MATVTLQVIQTFPVGTSVDAYELHESPGDGPPPAPVSATGVVDVFGVVTFTGLVADSEYVAGALLGGRWRYVEFTTFQFTDPTTAGSTGGLDAALLGAANGVAQLNGSSQIPLGNLPLIPAAKVGSDVATKAQLDAVAATVVSGPRPAIPGTGGSRGPSYGTLGAPLTANFGVSLADAVNSVTSTDLYAVVFIAANLSFTLTNYQATGFTAVSLEVHQVGGPWTLTPTKSVLTEGGDGVPLTTTAGAVDILTMWTPDGVSWRASIQNDYQ